MAVKRKTWKLRQGEVIDVEENHDGRYGAPGEKRTPRKKPTPEQIEKVNRQNKSKKCRRKLIQYFTAGDFFTTWTYRPDRRPEDMKGALKDFQKAVRIVRQEYKKRGETLYWIRNIEKGTKGAWHIHVAINRIQDTADILVKAWPHGRMDISQITNSPFYDEDFTKLANYMTKDQGTQEIKKDGTIAKPRLSEANYGCSRNMPLPEPKTDELKRWKDEPKPKKGYYISKIYEGINPVTGFKFRRYTMIRLQKGGGTNGRHGPLYHDRQCHSKKE